MSSIKPFLIVAAAAFAAFVLTGSGARAQAGTTLHGTVGPGFTIVLTDAAGATVTHLDPGTYTVVVDDMAAEHDFHLSGPGVNQATDVEFIGTLTWTVTFTDGTYRYRCDPHASLMHGAFTVGTVTPPPPPKPKPGALVGTVGPGYAISLKKSSGASARTLKAGKYVVTAHDRSRSHNFHLTGPGVNVATSVPFVGTRTWTVTLKKGTYRFQCDAHKTRMKGTIRVT